VERQLLHVLLRLATQEKSGDADAARETRRPAEELAGRLPETRPVPAAP
jgi:hypothetical protein